MGICARTLLAAFLLVSTVHPTGAQQPASNIRFRFAFGALTGSGTNRNLVRITEDAHLKTGDKVKLMAEMEQPGFMYIIHRGPDGDIDLLLPADLKQSLQTGRSYSMPDGTAWFELDKNPGDETFYVMASAQRLTNLESLLQRYSSAPAAGKSAIGTEVVAEIRKLRTQNRDASAQAERPVMIGGNVRSIDSARGNAVPDIGTIAVEINAKDFFARTFTIDHR